MSRSLKSALVFIAILLAGLAPATGVAQGLSAPKAAAPAADPLGRGSPSGLVSQTLGAIGSNKPERFTALFDLSRFAPARRDQAARIYARRLTAQLDAGGSLRGPATLSRLPQGASDDGLADNEELIGSARRADGTVLPLIASSTTINGVTVWRYSAATLAALPAAASVQRWRSALPRFLSEPSFAGAPLVDWVLLLVVAALIYYASRLAFSLVLGILARLRRSFQRERLWRFTDAASAPVSLIVSLILFLKVTSGLGVSIVPRAIIGQFAGGLIAVAFLWLVWRVLDAGSAMLIEGMEHAERRTAKSAVLFARRAAQVILGVLVLVVAFASIGINVTAGLAALGIGGIALALGAQKTVENIVGGVSIIADGSVRVGDSCRIGDVTGVIEEIGIRSTLVRTSERTRVTIPNGAMAATQIENYARRDRFLFAPVVSLRPDLTADGIEAVIAAIRAKLKDTDYVIGSGRVNLKALSAAAIDIETFAYLETKDADEAAAFRERLLLDVMRATEAAGGGLFPAKPAAASG